MLIRKLFKFEMAHIVRKAYTKRCSQNIHGHSYKLEVFLKGNQMDDAQMVVDFGLVKVHFNDFIDSFDHTLVLWNLPEDREIVKFACKNFERVIVMPFSSSAEMQAKMFYELFDVTLQTRMPVADRISGVADFKVEKCIVHETDTGYAEYKPMEFAKLPRTLYPINIFTHNVKDISEVVWDTDYIRMSEGIAKERKNKAFADVYNDSVAPFIM